MKILTSPPPGARALKLTHWIGLGVFLVISILGLWDGWLRRDIPTPWPQPINMIDQSGLSGELDDALGGLRLSFDVGPDISLARGLLKAAEAKGHLGNQLKAASFLAKNDPTPDNYAKLGGILLAMKRYDEAKKNFDKALGNPGVKAADILLGMAAVCEAQGDLNRAAETYRQALAANPGHEKVMLAYANLLFRQGRADESLRLIERVIAANPSHAEALNNQGILLAQSGRLDKALEAFNRALVLQPSSAMTHMNIGRVYEMMNKTSEAAYHKGEADRLARLQSENAVSRSPKPSGGVPSNPPRAY